MKIDKHLNLVIPLVNEHDVEIAYVHSTPIPRMVFEQYYLILAKVFATLYSENVGYLGGPRIADMLLRDEAKEMKIWDTPNGVQRGLMAHIYRLTNVICVAPEGGWQTLPYEIAKKENHVSEEDAAEVESAIVFFIVGYAMHRRDKHQHLVFTPLKMLDASTTSLDVTMYKNSLKILTPDELSGKKPE